MYDGQIDDLMKKYANKKFIRYQQKGSLEWNEIEVPNEAKFVESAIKELYEKKEIEDLEIQNVPLEEIIEQFYK
ncbi:MAG: hypothetical protein WCG25_04540 [bacterium]